MNQTAEKEKNLKHFSETFKEKVTPFSKNRRADTSSISLKKKTYTYSLHNAIRGDYKNTFQKKKSRNVRKRRFFLL